MAGLRARTRFATLLAVGLALLVSGVVAGAAGGNFILGAANSAGSANTSLSTTSTGNALLVTQNGTGTAIRGSTGSGAGIAGFFTSGSGSGVSGVVAHQDKYGVFASNDSAVEGTGAALRASGQQNEGVIATSADTNAVRGLVTGCDGLLCGGNGVAGDGYGFAAGVFGEGTDTLAGLWAQEGLAAAVYAIQSGTDIPAIYGDSSAGTGVVGYGENGSSITETTPAGGQFSGPNGVYGQTDVGFGTGVLARANGALNWALRADGFTFLDGNLDISGTCTGCTGGINAVNGGGTTLKQGDAVALEGVTQAKDGRIMLIVRAATRTDAVIGVVDREMKAAPASITIGGEKRTINVNRQGEKQITSPDRTLKAPAVLWQEGGTSVAAGKNLRIITSGVFAYEGAAPADAAVGQALAVDGTNGRLSAASANAAATAGRYLGKLADGRIVVLVNPS